MKKQPPITLTVRLPAPLHRKMVAHAARADRSGAQVIRQALSEFLDREGAK